MVQLSRKRLGQGHPVIDASPVVRAGGKADVEWQAAYRALFRGTMSDRELAAIREATSKAWVLGDDRFEAQIEARTGRRTKPLGRGGDTKPAVYPETRNQ